MFLKRCEFLYKTLSNMSCLAIRKHRFNEVQDKYGRITQKLKLRVFQRYKDIIRKPTLEHKTETLLQLQRINKTHMSDYGFGSANDKSEEDEKQLRKEMEKFGGEGQAQLKRIKKLEEKVEQLGIIVNGMFAKYDTQMKELTE